MFYSNRSACYLYFKPPRHDLVIEDCNAALAIDKTYVKPLARRAGAYEASDQLEDALRDYTAAVILDRFATQSNNSALDRVLKTLAQQKASETIKVRAYVRVMSGCSCRTAEPHSATSIHHLHHRVLFVLPSTSVLRKSCHTR